MQQTTFSPVFEYSKIHHIERVTPEFIKFLKSSVEMHVHVTPHVDPPLDRLGTSNEIVKDSILSGEPKGYSVTPGQSAASNRPKVDQQKISEMESELSEVKQENTLLRARIHELELRLAQVEGTPMKRKSIESARLKDYIVNGGDAEPGTS